MMRKTNKEIKSAPIAKFSAGIMIVLLSVVIVLSSVTLLFKVWLNQSKPITYVITGIQANDKIKLPECEEQTITIITKVGTTEEQYRCGSLGYINELITIYK